MKTITTPDKSNLPIRQIQDKYPQLLEEISKSEREKSVILDAMTELVLYLDTDLKVIWANKAMHAAFNLAPGQLNGKHCYMALHNRSRACRICPAEKTLKTGEPHEVIDISSYKKNWVLRSYPVRDEKGSLTGVVEIVTDITERKRAEEALRQSEQKYRELFENANDVIFILDFDGTILSCNAAVSKTYGYEPEQIMGRSKRIFWIRSICPLSGNSFERKSAIWKHKTHRNSSPTQKTVKRSGWRLMPGS